MSGYLFANTFAAMLLAAVAPEGWAAMAVLVAVAVAAQRRADRDDPDARLRSRGRWLLELLSLLLIPLGLLVAASQMDGPAAGSRNMNTVYYALVGAVALQLALGSGLIWRHRQRWLATVILAGGLCWWAVGTALIAYMALTDNWI